MKKYNFTGSVPGSLGKMVLMVILILGLAPRLYFLTKDAHKLVSILPDDCFYYLKTAKYIVTGYGSTFDGSHLTNGYHPLWLLLILPLAFFCHHPLVFLKSVLVLSILANSLAAYVLYRLLNKVTDRWWIPLVGVTFYFFNPQTMATSLDGLGTTVSTLLFVIILYLNVSEWKGGLRIKGYPLFLGSLLGLLFLARTDNIFYIIVFFLASLVKKAGKTNLKKRVLLVILGIAIVTAPWFIWSWLRFGTLMQSQGLSLPYAKQQSYLSGHKTYGQLLLVSSWLFINFFSRDLYYCLGIPSALLASSIFAFFLLIFTIRWQDSELQNRELIYHCVKISLFLYLAALFLIFSHAFLRWFPRVWYFDQLIILSAFFLAMGLMVFDPEGVLAKAVRSFYPRANWNNPFTNNAIIITVTLLLLLPLFSGTKKLASGDYPWQIEMLDAAYWLRDNTLPKEKAAAFNTGIIGFFSEREVMNLDGAINNSAYRAIKKRQLMKLMHDSDVRYYLDYDPAMLEWYSLFLGEMRNRVRMSALAEIDSPGVDWQGYHIRIYRLDWEGSL